MSDTPSAAPQEPKLEGSLYMFREPELLSKEKHADLGISRPDSPFAFAANVRAVPLVVTEIAAAQKHYPIIFTDEQNPMPLAVTGLIDDVNLFVNDKGEWDQNVYIPGYVRRYPFALAGDQGSNRMALILDSAYEGIKKGSDLPFFDGDKLSAATQQAMDYCTNYERDRQVTVNFAQQLASYNIVSNQVAQFTPQGSEQPQPFAQYNGVEEQKLSALPEDKFLALRQANILPILYAQLMSMGNWRLLMERRVRRFNLKGEEMLKPVTKQ